MKAKIRRPIRTPARPNVGLIVIDYLQLMTSGQRSENRVQEISSITRNLKIMAKEMNVPIIAPVSCPAVEKQGNNSSHRPSCPTCVTWLHRAGRRPRVLPGCTATLLRQP